MPSKSTKQANFMAACAHGAGYANCPPSKVSKEFNQADKGRGIIGKRTTGGTHMRARTAAGDHMRKHGWHKV